MSGWRQMAGGLAITLVVITVIGISLTTAIAENRLLVEPLAPTRTAAASATPAPASSTPNTGGSTSSAAPTGDGATLTATLPPPPPSCMPPEGWLPYVIREGDSLQSIAAEIGADIDALREANCLTIDSLLPNTILYLPALPPTATFTPSPTSAASSTVIGTTVMCGPPSGWVIYIVRSGDTLFSLAQATGTSVFQIQSANCMGSSTYIQAGAQLWLSFIPTATPTATSTPTTQPSATSSPAPSASPTWTPTQTNTAPPPSQTPTITPSPSPSPTLTPSPTETGHAPTPTGTETAAPASNDQCPLEFCASLP